jgi:hypothetical protein
MWSALTTASISLPASLLWSVWAKGIAGWMVLACFAFTVGVPFLVGAVIVGAATWRHGVGGRRLRRALLRTDDAYRDLARVTPPLEVAESRSEAALHALARSGWLTILGLVAFQVLLAVVLGRSVPQP